MNVHAFHIDPETLHEVPDHPVEQAAWLDRQTPDDYRSWTGAGQAAHLLRRLDQAEHALGRALALHPTIAARLRRARGLQWQGRFAEAGAEFDRCVREPGEFRHFAHQHAGECRYDEGRWDLAPAHFRESLRLRANASEELVASAAPAVDAADACLTAATAAVELHRLVPAVHRDAGRQVVARITERPPHLGLLGDFASLLTIGPASRQVLRGLHRYHLDIDAVPDHPMTAAVTGTAPAARLFDRLRALRYDRANAHAAAWQAEVLTATEVQALPADAPQRLRIEAATDRIASRPYCSINAESRANLIHNLRALPRTPV